MTSSNHFDRAHVRLVTLIERHEMLRNRHFLRRENPWLPNVACDLAYCENYAALFRKVYQAHEDELVAAFGCPPTKPITEEALRPIIGEWGHSYNHAA